MQSIIKIPNLKYLKLASNRIGADENSVVKRSDFTQEYQSPVDEFLMLLQKFPNLTSLIISNNYIGDNFISPLCLLNLQCLDLSWNAIGIIGADILGKALLKLNLVELNVSWNQFGGSGAVEIVQNVDVNSTLKKLSLNGNRITDKDMIRIISKLYLNKYLERLEIACNFITQSDTIRPLLSHSSLNTIDINNNPVQLTAIPSSDSKVRFVKQGNINCVSGQRAERALTTGRMTFVDG
jgi:Leucine-rich repeat (LRR) protein